MTRGLATALALGGFLAALAGGCVVDVDYANASLRCAEDGLCPRDFTCINAVCVPDSQVDDVLGPDASTEPDAGVDAAPASCADTFGALPQFELCEEAEATCTFAALTDGGTCRELCETVGRDCVTAFDNADPVCESLGEDGCDQPRMTEICVCAR